MQNRNSGLDLLRSIAILSVLLLHASQLTPNAPSYILYLSSYGWMGVDLFFVLSGFLIGNQFISIDSNSDPKKSIQHFYIKRIFRILPLYFFVLFSYTILKPMLGFPFQGKTWHYLLFIQNYIGMKDFVPSWSLCIEEQFYIFFPILILFWRRYKFSPIFWLAPAAISIIARFIYIHNNFDQLPNFTMLSNDIMFKTHMHLDGLSMGVFLSATRFQWNKWNSRQNSAALLAGILIIFLTCLVGGSSMEKWAAVYCFFSISLGFSLLFPCITKLNLPSIISAPIHKVAIWSYGIYIWNDVVSRFLHKMPIRNWELSYLCFITLSILTAMATYYTIEIFFLKFRENFT